LVDGLIKSKVKKMQNYISKFRIITFLIIGFVLFPAVSLAAKLYLEPAQGQYYQGDNFMVEVRIDPENECINTVNANISFSQDILKADQFSQGNSILTLWVKNPEISQDSGIISFIGGIPGGFCGRLAGDPGRSNLLGKIVFQVKEVNSELLSGKTAARVKFSDDSQILLNDGFGTPAKLITQNAEFNILAGAAQTPKTEWQEELEKDLIPPEPFGVEALKNPSIFNNKYFIVFSTSDKQTGVDFYEVKEGERDWKRAVSPYLLENQRLGSIIKVKAVDRAGNERIIEYLPPKKPIPYWLIIPVLILGAAIWLLIRKILKSKRKK